MYLLCNVGEMEICTKSTNEKNLLIIGEAFEGCCAISFAYRFADFLNEGEQLGALLADQALTQEVAKSAHITSQI